MQTNGPRARAHVKDLLATANLSPSSASSAIWTPKRTHTVTSQARTHAQFLCLSISLSIQHHHHSSPAATRGWCCHHTQHPHHGPREACISGPWNLHHYCVNCHRFLHPAPDPGPATCSSTSSSTRQAAWATCLAFQVAAPLSKCCTAGRTQLPRPAAFLLQTQPCTHSTHQASTAAPSVCWTHERRQTQAMHANPC